jgi:hypothetical protein
MYNQRGASGKVQYRENAACAAKQRDENEKMKNLNTIH